MRSQRLFRVIQGLSGGGLQPCSQGILMDTFPPEKQGTAMTLFGLGAIIAPVVAPTLGGWLCVDYTGSGAFCQKGDEGGRAPGTRQISRKTWPVGGKYTTSDVAGSCY